MPATQLLFCYCGVRLPQALLCHGSTPAWAVQCHSTSPPFSCAVRQTLVDPEAAAKRKMRKQQRKASGKRKQMEHVKRLRAAGVAGAVAGRW